MAPLRAWIATVFRMIVSLEVQAASSIPSTEAFKLLGSGERISVLKWGLPFAFFRRSSRCFDWRIKSQPLRYFMLKMTTKLDRPCPSIRGLTLSDQSSPTTKTSRRYIRHRHSAKTMQALLLCFVEALVLENLRVCACATT